MYLPPKGSFLYHVWCTLPLCPPPPVPPGTHHSVVCIYEFVLFVCYFLFYILHMSEIMFFVLFCVILLSIILSRSIHVATNGNILSFLWLNNIPLNMCTTATSHHLSTDTSVVSMSWLLWIGCSEHTAAHIFTKKCVNILGINVLGTLYILEILIFCLII